MDSLLLEVIFSMTIFANNKSYKTKLLYLPHEDLTGGRQLTGGQQDVKQNGRRGHHGRRSQ